MSLEPYFERLVAEHHGPVLRLCRSILRDEHLGADAAQETFVRFFQLMRARRAPRSSGAWLARVAARVSIDLLRRRSASDGALGRSDAVEPISDPEAETHSFEVRERFEHALATLSEGQRTVFLLRHSGGMTLAEVAELLGVALPTAKTQFARACIRLQHALRAFEPDAEDEDERERGS